MSDLVLHVAASQWQQLTDFGEFLQNEVCLWESPTEDAARYLRYFNGFDDQMWRGIVEHHQAHSNPATGKMAIPAQHPSEDVPEYEISGVAMQFRLLFGFAAQYTVTAFDAVTVFLKDHHGYSAEEWESVLAFLEAQEENSKPG